MLLLLGSAPLVWAKTWYVGVLAPQGAVAAAQTKWQPRLDWSEHNMAGNDFVLLPLSLQSWRGELTSGKLDFALEPQVQFVTLPNTQGWRWLETLQ